MILIVLTYLFNFFFFTTFRQHRDLHSFPTRRSSDLTRLARRHTAKKLERQSASSRPESRRTLACFIFGSFCIFLEKLRCGAEITDLQHHRSPQWTVRRGIPDAFRPYIDGPSGKL